MNSVGLGAPGARTSTTRCPVFVPVCPTPTRYYTRCLTHSSHGPSPLTDTPFSCPPDANAQIVICSHCATPQDIDRPACGGSNRLPFSAPSHGHADAYGSSCANHLLGATPPCHLQATCRSSPSGRTPKAEVPIRLPHATQRVSSVTMTRRERARSNEVCTWTERAFWRLHSTCAWRVFFWTWHEIERSASSTSHSGASAGSSCSASNNSSSEPCDCSSCRAGVSIGSSPGFGCK
mmetsp:Transcript_7763/g.17007  ORF Transcript_7763/g.17007 Transcript_7763/m.17007 type:complete len:235 (+) Transcript_7763:122-826(+)